MAKALSTAYETDFQVDHPARTVIVSFYDYKTRETVRFRYPFYGKDVIVEHAVSRYETRDIEK